MTVAVPGVGVISRKPKWKQLLLPEIPAARFSCLTSGSFRPKLGLSILSIVLLGSLFLIVIPFVAPSLAPFSSPFVSKSCDNQKCDSESSSRLLSAMSSTEVQNKEAVAAVAKANAEFTKKIYKELTGGERDKNMIMSPFSIEQVVAMVMTGAAGKTAHQIRSGMSFPIEEHLLNGYAEVLGHIKQAGQSEYTLDTANRLYTQSGYNFLDDFLMKSKKHFMAEPVPTNFAESETARASINSWVEEQTHTKIKDLIPQGVINTLTRLVLVNAVYFKGDWDNKFNENATSKQDFTTEGGKTVKVDMMRKKGNFGALQLKELGAMALEMPYKGKRMSMIFVLPKKTNGLAELESKLASFDLASALVFQHKPEMNVGIPKFKLESTHDLNNALQNLGMTDMFNGDLADFSGMTGDKDLYISKVMQKAFIEVNEEGSEAAAATAGIMMMRAAIMTPEFICDHPFIFLIKDNLTGLILFAGRVTDPNTK